MKSEWKVKKIKDCGKVITGKTPPTKITEYFGGSYPFITIPDLDGRREISTSARSLSHLGAKLLNRCQLPANTVMMSCIATIGKCGMTVQPSFTNQQINSVICNSKVLPKYLYYIFLTLTPTLEATGGGGSVYTNISKSRFSEVQISLPPLAEQRAIAHILGTLDDKIELNRKQNETLEEMARALFKAWFIDFEPVRAKIEGRWKRGQSLPGLPTHLYDLFPSRLVESELGEIPEGWEVDRVGSHFNLTMGQSPPGDTYNDIGDGLPFFQGRTDFGFRYPKNRIYCTAPTRIANMEDTLVSVRAPVGDINLAWERCCIGRGVAAIRHNFGARSFTYHAMRSLQPEINQYEHTGTVFGSINRKQFQELIFIAPPENLVPAFESIAGIFDDKVRNNLAQSRTLAELRDTLLPKLISGELRVKDAERFVSGKM
jgi:type I restriction enzyme S subunit